MKELRAKWKRKRRRGKDSDYCIYLDVLRTEMKWEQCKACNLYWVTCPGHISIRKVKI